MPELRRQSTFPCLLLLALVGACHTAAPRSDAPEKTQSDAKPPDPRAEYPVDPEVGDLEPMAPRRSPGDVARYDELLHELLFGGLDTAAWMSSAPSFKPEYGVAIVLVPIETNAGDGKPVDPDHTYELVVARTRKQLWPLVSAGTKLTIAELRKRTEVERISVPIDEPAAAEIIGAWESVVRRTHYPRPKYVFDDQGNRYQMGETRTTDGTGYRFGAYRYFGEANTPHRGLARDLVDFVDSLKALALANEAQRPKLLQSARERAEHLRSVAEHAPW